MVALNADIGEFGLEHKSGAELWRLLVLNYEKKSAYNVVSVVEMSSGFCECVSTYSPSSLISPNSLLSELLRSRVLACVISPRLKSNTSSESSLRMCMQFSHITSLIFAAPVRSEMNDGHRCGHSCFTTCRNTTKG